MHPAWLPPLITLNGSISDDYKKLYKVFQTDILQNTLTIDGYPVAVDLGKDNYLPQYERGFTHLVTAGDGMGGRTIDYKRAKKLPWVRAVIENYQEPEVYAFWQVRPKEEVLYLWLADEDFVVILKWMGGSSKKTKIIVTAYHVENFNRKYFQRIYGQAGKDKIL